LLRFVTQAFGFESVGRSALRFADFTEVCSLVKQMLVVSDHPADADSAMDGMVNQFIALLDHWSSHEGILHAGPKSLHAKMGMSPFQTTMYTMCAVPMAQGVVQKKRCLSMEEAQECVAIPMPEHAGA
jgi:hypothetical protein